MNNWQKIFLSLPLIGILGFFIASGSYMTKVSNNSEAIEEIEVKLEVTDKLSKVALNRSKEALEKSEESIESDRKTEEMIRSFHNALEEIKRSVAVSNERDRNTQRAVNRIEKMLIKHVEASNQ